MVRLIVFGKVLASNLEIDDRPPPFARTQTVFEIPTWHLKITVGHDARQARSVTPSWKRS